MIGPLVLLLAYTFPETVQPGEKLIVVGQGEFQSCTIVARVTGTASVRVAPSSTATEKEKVRGGQMLSLCGEDGDYVAVVYKPSSDGETDCGVAAPPPFVAAYRGPCRFGWVESRKLELVEG